jgi:hypothetical protein
MKDKQNRLVKAPPLMGPVQPPGGLELRGEHSDRVTTQLSKHLLIYSILGLVLGLVCVIGGLVLFLEGVSGKMSWTAKFLGASSQILDAAPGAVLFIVGLFVVFLTRYKVDSKR